MTNVTNRIAISCQLGCSYQQRLFAKDKVRINKDAERAINEPTDTDLPHIRAPIAKGLEVILRTTAKYIWKSYNKTIVTIK